MYKVLFDRDVEKDLNRIPKEIARRILAKCLSLANQPRGHQSIKLEGTENIYRFRVGDYRIIYQIDDKGKTVTVYHVRQRQSAYRGY